MSKKIIIVFGDPNSINSEIIYKTWKKLNKSLKKRIFLISNTSLLSQQFKKLKYSIKIETVNNLNQKINFFSTQEGRKELVTSLKKEIKKANEKENYLDEEERELLRNFIIKIKKELEFNN